MAKLLVFNRKASRVGDFIIACRLYLRMKMRGTIVKEQIQWMLAYVQEGLVNVLKENLLKDLESGEVKFGLVGEFLLELKTGFGEGDKELGKVVELRRIEQGRRTMEEFVQKFQRATRSSGYKGRALVEEFKREINETIKRKLIEAERLPTRIEQQYKCATNLDRYWRETRREEKQFMREREQKSETETDKYRE